MQITGHWPPRRPPEGDRYAHAWFGGFLQELAADGSANWSVEPRIAMAVLVEFGGSGGRTSGPLAKRVAAAVVEAFGPELDTGCETSSRALP